VAISASSSTSPCPAARARTAALVDMGRTGKMSAVFCLEPERVAQRSGPDRGDVGLTATGGLGTRMVRLIVGGTASRIVGS
jgi:hypothetical protein